MMLAIFHKLFNNCLGLPVCPDAVIPWPLPSITTLCSLDNLFFNNALFSSHKLTHALSSKLSVPSIRFLTKHTQRNMYENFYI